MAAEGSLKSTLRTEGEDQVGKGTSRVPVPLVPPESELWNLPVSFWSHHILCPPQSCVPASLPSRPLSPIPDRRHVRDMRQGCQKKKDLMNALKWRFLRHYQEALWGDMEGGEVMVEFWPVVIILLKEQSSWRK